MPSINQPYPRPKPQRRYRRRGSGHVRRTFTVSRGDVENIEALSAIYADRLGLHPSDSLILGIALCHLRDTVLARGSLPMPQELREELTPVA